MPSIWTVGGYALLLLRSSSYLLYGTRFELDFQEVPMGPWLVPNEYLTVNVWPMTDFCMHRLDAFPHSKLEAVLYARASPYRLYSIGFRSCQGLRINPQPFIVFSCILFRARRRYHI